MVVSHNIHVYNRVYIYTGWAPSSLAKLENIIITSIAHDTYDYI